MNLRDVYSFTHHVSLRACPVPGTGPGPGDQGPGEVIKLMMTDGGGERSKASRMTPGFQPLRVLG